MSIKQDATQVTNEFFETHQNADKTISASELAALVQRDAKTLRAYLRKIEYRDQSEFKGARYRIAKTDATSVKTHFMRLDQRNDESEEQAS